MEKTYNVEDIFQDDPDNPENVIMTIPDEIMEKMGWTAGDTLSFDIQDGVVSIVKVENTIE
jgi:bifunctional DNA-binding transcriptional regulator/antitoxin component of YhaV-PrlF toxin-antitoxin module